MGIVRLAREKDTYIITSNTDEELYVIAQLLLDKDTVVKAQAFLNSHETEKRISTFNLKKLSGNTVEITFFGKTESPLQKDNPLDIIINSYMLDDIIDAWQLFMIEKPDTLILSRKHDENQVYLTTHELDQE